MVLYHFIQLLKKDIKKIIHILLDHLNNNMNIKNNYGDIQLNLKINYERYEIAKLIIKSMIEKIVLLKHLIIQQEDIIIMNITNHKSIK